ncbi:hypothetical protein BH23GEM1_BH23GEM1_07480 [soil metagenome]
MKISVLAMLALAVPVAAQQPDSTATGVADSVVRPAVSRPAVDLSGVLFANYQYHVNRGSTGGTNRFDLERAYFTLKASAGQHASIRLTTDVFQHTRAGGDDDYKDWTIRAKYAYLQLDYLRRGTAHGLVRFGLIQNVFIDHDESFWPRWISKVPTDKHGYFSSADAGVATLFTLPAKLGEAYAAITNGPGYTSRETDRFKDYAARLTAKPFGRLGEGLLPSLSLTAWTYRGAVGSRFAEPELGQVGTVGSSLNRSRWGVLAAVRNPWVTVAAQYAERSDESETGENTAALPRAVTDSAGTLESVYALLRPFARRPGRASAISLLARTDKVVNHRELRHHHNFFVGGVILDLTESASLSLDYQELLPRFGDPAPRSRVVFLHLVGRF